MTNIRLEEPEKLFCLLICFWFFNGFSISRLSRLTCTFRAKSISTYVSKIPMWIRTCYHQHLLWLPGYPEVPWSEETPKNQEPPKSHPDHLQTPMLDHVGDKFEPIGFLMRHPGDTQDASRTTRLIDAISIWYRYCIEIVSILVFRVCFFLFVFAVPCSLFPCALI